MCPLRTFNYLIWSSIKFYNQIPKHIKCHHQLTANLQAKLSVHLQLQSLSVSLLSVHNLRKLSRLKTAGLQVEIMRSQQNMLTHWPEMPNQNGLMSHHALWLSSWWPSGSTWSSCAFSSRLRPTSLDRCNRKHKDLTKLLQITKMTMTTQFQRASDMLRAFSVSVSSFGSSLSSFGVLSIPVASVLVSTSMTKPKTLHSTPMLTKLLEEPSWPSSMFSVVS